MSRSKKESIASNVIGGVSAGVTRLLRVTHSLSSRMASSVSSALSTGAVTQPQAEKKEHEENNQSNSYGSVLYNLGSRVRTGVARLVGSTNSLGRASFLVLISPAAANHTESHYVNIPIIVPINNGNGRESWIAATFSYCTDAFKMKSGFGTISSVPEQITALFANQSCAILDPTNGTGIDYNLLDGAGLTSCQGHENATGVFPDATFTGNFELWQNLSDCFVQLGTAACNTLAQLQQEQNQYNTAVVVTGVVGLTVLTAGVAVTGFCLYKKRRARNEYDEIDGENHDRAGLVEGGGRGDLEGENSGPSNT